MTAVCILRGRDRLCLLGRPWIEIEATSPPSGCTGYFVNPIFWGLMVHAVLVYVRAPTVCTDSDFRRFSADVLFPSIVADPWFAVPSSIWACACGCFCLQRDAWFTLVHAMCHSTEISPCLCGRAVRRFFAVPGFKLSFRPREGCTGQCVTLILRRTSLSRGCRQ